MKKPNKKNTKKGGCCSKGEDSDEDLRRKNPPTEPPPQNQSRNPASESEAKLSSTPTTVADETKSRNPDEDEPEEKQEVQDDNIYAVEEEPEGLANESDNKDEGDKDDAPMIIQATIREDTENTENTENTRTFDSWVTLCLIVFLILTVIGLLCYFMYLIFAPRTATTLAFVAYDSGVKPNGACVSSPCKNFGACFSPPGRPYDFVCTCRDGFSGPDCGKIDPCMEEGNIMCAPNGKCVKDDENGSHTCFCDQGYFGDRCEYYHPKKLV